VWHECGIEVEEEGTCSFGSEGVQFCRKRENESRRRSRVYGKVEGAGLDLSRDRIHCRDRRGEAKRESLSEKENGTERQKMRETVEVDGLGFVLGSDLKRSLRIDA